MLTLGWPQASHLKTLHVTTSVKSLLLCKVTDSQVLGNGDVGALRDHYSADHNIRSWLQKYELSGPRNRDSTEDGGGVLVREGTDVSPGGTVLCFASCRISITSTHSTAAAPGQPQATCR